ncbi:MAG: hypothetical protein R2748_02975 [Bryobacterales bacterium]
MCWLPLPLARALAGQLARLLYRVTKRWRAIAERNLEIAFPDVPQARRQEILRGSYDNLGRVILALARLPR